MLNAEEMIRQLKPLLGERADRIWKAYLTGDTEDRKIIQHSLENLHAQMVDDYAHEKILLQTQERGGPVKASRCNLCQTLLYGLFDLTADFVAQFLGRWVAHKRDHIRQNFFRTREG